MQFYVKLNLLKKRFLVIMEISSGILVYRFKNNILQVFLGKCGGPAWEKRNKGAWNIPKGHVEEDENVFDAAKREFYEETGLTFEGIINSNYIYLGEAATKSRKKVHIYAVEYNFDPVDNSDIIMIKSNLCETEWPRKSGNIIMIPELGSAKYVDINIAKEIIFPYQLTFLERLEQEVNEK